MWGRFGSVRNRTYSTRSKLFSTLLFSFCFFLCFSFHCIASFPLLPSQSKANKKKDGRKERDFVKDYTIYDTTDFKKSNTFRFDFNFNFNFTYSCLFVLMSYCFALCFVFHFVLSFFFPFFFLSYLFNTTILTHIRISFYLLPPILFFFFCGQF